MKSYFISFFAFLLVFVASLAFVPQVAEAKTCRYSHSCYYSITKDAVTYDVTGTAEYSRTCGNNSFPAWGCDFVKAEIIERIAPGVLSGSWGLACGNVHSFSASVIPPGQCGSANNATTTSFPTSNLCNVGTAINSATSSTHFTWSCQGDTRTSSASCSAPRAVNFVLNCTNNPASGVVNSAVNFSTSITGTTTAASAFTYSWKVNGATVGGNTQTLSHTFTAPTSTAEVFVTATRGNQSATKKCPLTRVDCGSGQVYCGDATPPTSYACAPSITQCPRSICATSYAIADDKQLVPGGFLVENNSFCGVGSTIRQTSVGVSSWKFEPAYSTWKWECKNANAVNIASCGARCANGEYFCNSTNRCTSDTDSCDCQLEDDLSGAIVDQREYCVATSGNCYACGKVLSYFVLRPDEVPQAPAGASQGTQLGARLCGGYWDAQEIPVDSRPAGTTETQVVCTMKTGNSAPVSVPSDRPVAAGVPYDLPVGNHELTCIQQYKSSENPNPNAWMNLQSSSLTARCRALPAVFEN